MPKARARGSATTPTVMPATTSPQAPAALINTGRAKTPPFVSPLHSPPLPYKPSTPSPGEAGSNCPQQATDACIGPMDIPFVTNQEGLESKAYWQNVPDGNMAFIQRIGVPESKFNEPAKKFAAAYRAKTGKAAIEPYALEAYDSIAILAQAIKEAGSTDGDKIVDALEKISFVGTLGKIYFPYGTKKDPSADGKGNEWWHQWPDVALTVIQYQKKGEDSVNATIVYPPAYKTGEPIYVKK